MKIKSVFISVLLLVAPLSFIGCNGTLDPTGVYAGDKTLYNADLTYNAAYAAVDTFLKYETANRGTAAAPASVTASADELRLKWPAIKDAYFATRDAYSANKSNSNLTSFTKALADVSTILTTASGYIAATSITPTK